MTCSHEEFDANVEISRMTDGPDTPVTDWSVDVRINCRQCGVPLRFLGVPVGVSFSHPTTSPDGLELRCPMEPGPRSISAGRAYYELPPRLGRPQP